MSATDEHTRAKEAASAGAIQRLAVAWQNPATRGICPVGMLEFDGTFYTFFYIQNVLNVQDFQPLPGFPELTRRYESTFLFPLFAQRVMDPRRHDYERYIDRLGLDSEATPWEQMSRSGGGREGDTLQLFPAPTLLPSGQLKCTFLVHGIRHVPDRPLVLSGEQVVVTAEELEQRLTQLYEGQPLQLIAETNNPVNSAAVIVAAADGFPLGWVPNLLLEDLWEFTGRNFDRLEVAVVKANNIEAPAHMRLLASLRVIPIGHYTPFTGESWHPLVSN